MHKHLAGLPSHSQQRYKMGKRGMDGAGSKKTDYMHSAAVLSGMSKNSRQGGVLPQGVVLDNPIDTRIVLFDGASGTDSEVADLGVARFTPAHADGEARRLKEGHGVVLPDLVYDGGLGF